MASSTVSGSAPATAASGSGLVLLTLASGQFLMTLDSSVMNVSIAQVAEDVGTTVTGIQTAITLYTLVMATLMITGGKIGSMIGRRRAFSIGLVIYGAGSLTTALAPNLTVLIIGWSFLEGVGAALIMPAIVGLVAANFVPDQRPRAYGLVASAGAIAVAAGPLIGGAVTTYLTWRLVFAGEVVIVAIILAVTRRIQDSAAHAERDLDLGGAALTAAGLGMIVFGVLKSGEWGWVLPKESAPSVLGLSGTCGLIIAGLVVLRVFVWWEQRVQARGHAPLVDLSMLHNPRLVGGLVMFFFQFLLQAGLFFTVPLFLSVALGLSAVETGVRLLPLSVTLLLAAVGVPKLWPQASPRRVVNIGVAALLAGIVALIGALEVGAGSEIVTLPLLLAGLGVGALASQLGAVTVSAVPDEQSGEVGGLQNTATNLGASLGTALAGSILIGALTATLVQGIQNNPAIPSEVSANADVKLASGVPFMSDASLETALNEAGLPSAQVDAIVEENETARIDGLRVSLTVLALLAAVALLFTRMIPVEPVGSASAGPGPAGTTSRGVTSTVSGTAAHATSAVARNARGTNYPREVAPEGTSNPPSRQEHTASDRVLTVPNVLSALRLVGVPVFLWLILSEHDGWALLVLMLSGVTDYLDGKIARRYGLESKVGALLDPIADRLYILTTLLALAWREVIPWWLVGLLLGRELFMVLVLLYARRKGHLTLPVHFVGKAATFNLLYAFPLLLLGDGDSTFAEVARAVGWGFAWWGTALYWVAGILYAVQAARLPRHAPAVRTKGSSTSADGVTREVAP